jgi:hypothetical protein
MVDVNEPKLAKLIVEDALTASNFEAWHKIFVYLPENELINVQLTCKKFHRILETNTHSKTSKFDDWS